MKLKSPKKLNNFQKCIFKKISSTLMKFCIKYYVHVLKICAYFKINLSKLAFFVDFRMQSSRSNAYDLQNALLICSF